MNEVDGSKPPAAWLRQLREAGHWDRLIELAGKSLAMDPNDPETHRQIAWAYAASDRPAKMKPQVDFLLASEAEDAATHHLAAVYFLDTKRHQLARPHIETLLRLAPHSATYHYLACLLFLRENKVKEARMHVQEARKLSPEWVAAAHLEIRMDAIHQRKAHEAWARIRRLEETLAFDPNNAAVQTTIGEIYLHELERPREAEQFFRQALFVEPSRKERQAKLFDAIRARSLLYRTLSLPMQAIRLLARRAQRGGFQIIFLVVAIKGLLIFVAWFIVVGAFFTPAAYIYEWLVLADVMRLRPLPRWLAPLRMVLQWPLWLRMAICSAIIIGAWLLFLTKLCRLQMAPSLTIIGCIFGFHYSLVAVFVGLRKMRMRFGRWQEQRRHARELGTAAAPQLSALNSRFSKAGTG